MRVREEGKGGRRSREEGPGGADRGCNLECIFPNKLEPAGVEANSCGCGKGRGLGRPGETTGHTPRVLTRGQVPGWSVKKRLH